MNGRPYLCSQVRYLVILQYYSGGVYSSTQCSSSTLTHAMLVTGYGSYNGVDYYLVKNR